MVGPAAVQRERWWWLRRTGKCSGRLQGTCAYQHDSAKVAVCTSWLLTGACTAAKCVLQHRLCPDLMPLCSFFLQASALADPSRVLTRGR